MSDHSHDAHCVFCKIVQGTIPSATILETDDAVVILDIHPVNPGHVLIIPKSHYSMLADVPAESAATMARLLPALCQAIQAATGAHGYNLIANNGRAAGQTVDHVHWHIIPRFHDDAVSWPWPQGQYVGDELGQMQFRIHRELSLTRRLDFDPS